jgi:hypothetical protein
VNKELETDWQKFNPNNAIEEKWVGKFFLCQRMHRALKNKCVWFIAN